MGRQAKAVAPIASTLVNNPAEAPEALVQYIDFEKLEALDPTTYQRQKPYPWVNPADLIREDSYQALYQSLPDVSQLEKSFGAPRRAGQKPHDRYLLEYEEGLEVPAPWEEFIGELRGDRYRSALSRLLGVRTLEFRMHWHYAPNGSSVSPHCDAARKLGSHIFYFNTTADWKPEWGGETLVLDDGGRFARSSAPDFDDFPAAIASESLGNRSFIFSRSGKSWHGVREIQCPPDRMRRVFIVVLNQVTTWWRVRDTISRREIQRL